jgi:GT2 family glycosyltransferase
MITWNRPQYTAQALEHLLESCEPGMRVWVWHNGGHPETRKVVESFARHPRMYRLHASFENKRLREPTNWFWQHSDAPFVGKVDDDCLVPAGWARKLIDAHNQVPELGMLACWHFYDDDYVPELAQPKIREFAEGCRVLANCWVQGSGYVMKREVYKQLGPLGPQESFTDYGIRAALKGWTNGWYLPLIHEEHMDDPRSPYSRFVSEEVFQSNRPLSAINHGVETLAEWKNRARWMARSIQAAPCDPRFYVGWRAQVRRNIVRLKQKAGWREPWRLSR